MTFSVNPYFVNSSRDIFDASIHADHFILNTRKVDLGYFVQARFSVPYYHDFHFSMSGGLIALFGKRANKFEIAAGYNRPTQEHINYYEYIHLGIGYRLLPDDFRFTFRFGIASTGFIQGGIGFRLGKEWY